MYIPRTIPYHTIPYHTIPQYYVFTTPITYIYSRFQYIQYYRQDLYEMYYKIIDCRLQSRVEQRKAKQKQGCSLLGGSSDRNPGRGEMQEAGRGGGEGCTGGRKGEMGRGGSISYSVLSLSLRYVTFGSIIPFSASSVRRMHDTCVHDSTVPTACIGVVHTWCVLCSSK